MDKFSQKNHNCLFKTKFDIYSNLLNSVEFEGDTHFLCFGLELLFAGKFDPKTQNCLLKTQFVTEIKSNMLNLMVMFTFSVLSKQ